VVEPGSKEAFKRALEYRNGNGAGAGAAGGGGDSPLLGGSPDFGELINKHHELNGRMVRIDAIWYIRECSHVPVSVMLSMLMTTTITFPMKIELDLDRGHGQLEMILVMLF
jgi:hypothetical protein